MAQVNRAVRRLASAAGLSQVATGGGAPPAEAQVWQLVRRRLRRPAPPPSSTATATAVVASQATGRVALSAFALAAFLRGGCASPLAASGGGGDLCFGAIKSRGSGRRRSTVSNPDAEILSLAKAAAAGTAAAPAVAPIDAGTSQGEVFEVGGNGGGVAGGKEGGKGDEEKSAFVMMKVSGEVYGGGEGGEWEWTKVESLDQLYAQAVIVAPLLVALSGSWAAASGGALLFPATATQDDNKAKGTSALHLRRYAAPPALGSPCSRTACTTGIVTADSATPAICSPATDIASAKTARRAAEPSACHRRLIAALAVVRRILTAVLAHFSSEATLAEAAGLRLEEGVSPAAREWVRRGVIKGPRRAAAKLLVCYPRGGGGAWGSVSAVDVGRLLDVCRVRIGFSTPASLANCLELIMSSAKDVAGGSEGVRVVRVRNGMQEDAVNATGFRAVIVWLRMDTAETRSLGVDGHVSEVQLVVIGLEPPELQCPAAHQRYLYFRDVCAILRRPRWPPDLPPISEKEDAWPDEDKVVAQVKADFRGEALRAHSEPHLHQTAFSLDQAAQEGAAAAGGSPSVPAMNLRRGLDKPVVTAASHGYCDNNADGTTWVALFRSGSSGSGGADSACSGGGGYAEEEKGGQELEREWGRSALAVYRRCALRRAGVLGQKLADADWTVGTSGPGGVWFTSQPLQAAAHSPTFKIFFVISAISFFQRAAQSFAAATSGGYAFSAHVARFRVLETRGGLLSPFASNQSAAVGGFGLLVDGCSVFPLRADFGPGVVWADFGRRVRANGYFFATSFSAQPKADPVRWVVGVHSEAPEFSNMSNPELAAAANPSGGWLTVGSSAWEVSGGGALTLMDQAARLPPPGAPRGAEVRVDYRDAAPLQIYWGAHRACFGLSFLACAIIGLFGHERLAEPLQAIAGACALAIAVTAALWQHAKGKHDSAARTWAFSLPTLLLAVGIPCWPAKLLHVIALHGLASTLTVGLWTYTYSEGSLSFTWQAVANGLGSLSIPMLLIILGFRWRALRASDRLVQPDRERYRQAWQAESSAADSLGWYADLKCLAADISTRCPPPPLRQLTQQLSPLTSNSLTGTGLSWIAKAGWRSWLTNPRKETFEGGHASLKRSSREALSMVKITGKEDPTAHLLDECVVVEDFGNREEVRTEVMDDADEMPSGGCEGEGATPIRSLDQLYTQVALWPRARILHPILLHKVRNWAEACHGIFPVDDRSEFMTTTEADLANAFEEEKSAKAASQSRAIRGVPRFMTLAEARTAGGVRLRFAEVKAPARAVEKLVRSYRQDVSLLVDICRQSLVFRTGRDLVAALRAIASDARVRVLRVKNRLDPDVACGRGGAKGVDSEGYRDVLVNLQLRTAEARRRGVAGHVCEVLLLLQSFAEVKSDEGHRRYVAFRNLRGE